MDVVIKNYSITSGREERGQAKEERHSKRGIIWALVILLILLFSLVLTVFFIGQRTTFFGRAFLTTGSLGEVALENSYLFASPLSVQADGREKIRVTIFILDSQGKGVYGKPVFLGQDERLEQTAIQSVTDELGRAIFDISAKVPGEYFIEAKIDNQILPQRVRVSFR